MKHLKPSFFGVILLFCISAFSMQQLIAQNNRSSVTPDLVEGRVIDSHRNPIVGATITVEGTSRGTTSDSEGRFAIKATDSDLLHISFVGYKSVALRLAPGALHEILMEDETAAIDEVVVVGFGTQKKATLSGAVGTTSAKAFADKPSSHAMSALQGQVPGLNIIKTTGKPGREDWRMNIRGFSSNRDLSPLLIIDGVMYPDIAELQRMNASDIESISVLKDGAASIYGSRAAGGVILITTKKARQEKMQVSYDGTATLQTIGRYMEVMDRKEWFTANEIAMQNKNASFPFSGLKEYYMGDKSGYVLLRSDPAIQEAIGGNFSDVVDFGIFDTDWFDVFFGNAFSQKHNVTMSGATQRINYYISLGYDSQTSPLKWGEMYDDRYSGRVNLEAKLSKKITSRTNVSYENEKFVEPTSVDNVLKQIWGQQPGMPYQTIDGKPYCWGGQPALNWMLELGGNTVRKYSRINISQAFDYTPIKTDKQSLTFTGQLGINDWYFRSGALSQMVDYYDYSGTQLVRQSPSQSSTKYSASWDATLFQNYQLYGNYNLNFLEDHDLNVMLGTSYEKFRKEYISGARTGLTMPNLATMNIGDPSTATNSDKVETWGIASYFGRLNYSYKSKYIVEGNFRYDGSSRFISNKRWGFFGGVSAAWRISEEPFLKDTEIFQNLKIRASYGTTGNQSGIGLYDYVSRISEASYPFGETKYMTIKPGSMVSLDRSWEVLKSSNIGIDFTTARGKFSGSFDFYKKVNDDMLIGLKYPAVLGATAPATNSGTMETKGYELTLSWNDKIGKDFTYSINLGFSDSKSMMTYLGGPSVLSKGIKSYIEGYAPYTIFGYRTEGIIQNEAELAEFKARFPKGGVPTDWCVGCAKIVDKNGDGLLNDDDVFDLGSTEPRYGYSANIRMAWKGIDFNLYLQGFGQIMGYNQKAAYPFDAWYTNNAKFWVGKTALVGDDPANPGHKIVLNSEAKYPLAGVQTVKNYQYNDISVHNYAYLRLKDITLGYTFPETLTKKIGIAYLRVFVAGNDVCEWVNWDDGMDPERDWRSASSSNYPSMRSWSVGINLKF